MRTKLYVLGAVLGAAPGLLPVLCPLWGAPAQEARQESKAGAWRKRPAARREQGPGAPLAAPAQGPGEAGEAGPAGARHPCELVTVTQVPCDATAATCELTWWHCPQGVKPLRA